MKKINHKKTQYILHVSYTRNQSDFSTYQNYCKLCLHFYILNSKYLMTKMYIINTYIFEILHNNVVIGVDYIKISSVK